jgi:hypothetical protein
LWLAKLQLDKVAAQNTALIIRESVTGLRTFDDDQLRIPPAVTTSNTGERLSSWRFRIIKHLTSSNRTVDFEQMWSAPINPSSEVGMVLCRPNAQENPALKGRMTNVLAITGPGTAFEEGKVYRFSNLPPNLILLAEVRRSDLHWMEPGDLDVRTMPREINHPSGKGISGTTNYGFCVGFADGSAWILSFDTPYEVLSKFFTIEGAKNNDRDKLLGKYKLYAT